MTNIPSVILGADHGGFALKQALSAHLKQRGVPIEDAGPASPEPVDYPDYAHRVAGAVALRADPRPFRLGVRNVAAVADVLHSLLHRRHVREVLR